MDRYTEMVMEQVSRAAVLILKNDPNARINYGEMFKSQLIRNQKICDTMLTVGNPEGDLVRERMGQLVFSDIHKSIALRA